MKIIRKYYYIYVKVCEFCDYFVTTILLCDSFLPICKINIFFHNPVYNFRVPFSNFVYNK